jgi:hypothetical protein
MQFSFTHCHLHKEQLFFGHHLEKIKTHETKICRLVMSSVKTYYVSVQHDFYDADKLFYFLQVPFLTQSCLLTAFRISKPACASLNLYSLRLKILVVIDFFLQLFKKLQQTCKRYVKLKIHTTLKHIANKINRICIIFWIRRMVKIAEKKSMTTSILKRREYVIRKMNMYYYSSHHWLSGSTSRLRHPLVTLSGVYCHKKISSFVPPQSTGPWSA